MPPRKIRIRGRPITVSPTLKPLGHNAAIRERRGFVRGTKLENRLIVSIITDPAAPINSMRGASGQKQAEHKRDQHPCAGR